MSNSGIFITQVGASVPTAADYQFVFNSNWPSLQIVFSKTISINSGDHVVVPHNLGFYPLTMVYLTQDASVTLQWQGVLPGKAYTGRPDLEGGGFQTFIDKTNIYITGIANGSSMNIKCYNIDISAQKDYTLPKFPAVNQPYDSSVGIKVGKFGKDIHSTDLRDFILHSRAQSPAILSVVTEKSAKTSPLGGGLSRISYTNPANYVPWIYGFIGFTSTLTQFGLGSTFVYEAAIWGVQTSGLVISSVTASLDFFPSDPNNQVASLIVLRDPLVVPNPIRIQY